MYIKNVDIPSRILIFFFLCHLRYFCILKKKSKFRSATFFYATLEKIEIFMPTPFDASRKILMSPQNPYAKASSVFFPVTFFGLPVTLFEKVPVILKKCP